MSKKKPTKKLVVDKQSLRRIATADLGGVAGGSRNRGTVNGASATTITCVDDNPKG